MLKASHSRTLKRTSLHTKLLSKLTVRIPKYFINPNKIMHQLNSKGKVTTSLMLKKTSLQAIHLLSPMIRYQYPNKRK